MTEHPFNPDWTVPPGETLREWAQENDPEHTALARLYEPDSLQALLTGQRALTFEDAEWLEQLTGIPLRFWMRLEEHYREDLRLGRTCIV